MSRNRNRQNRKNFTNIFTGLNKWVAFGVTVVISIIAYSYGRLTGIANTAELTKAPNGGLPAAQPPVYDAISCTPRTIIFSQGPQSPIMPKTVVPEQALQQTKKLYALENMIPTGTYTPRTEVHYADTTPGAPHYKEQLVATHQVGQQCGFYWQENAILYPIDQVAAHPVRAEEFPKIDSSITDSLTLCYMGKFGHGVFLSPDAQEIPANTVIGIYSGIYRGGMQQASMDQLPAYIQAGVSRLAIDIPYIKDALITTKARAIMVKAQDLLAQHKKQPKTMQQLIVFINEMHDLFQRHEHAFDDDYTDHLPSHSGKSPHLVTAKRVGDLTRFLQHLPTESELAADPRVPENTRKHIATQNVVIKLGKTKSGLQYKYFETTRTIKPGEQIGWSYGIAYWKAKELLPTYFDKQGKAIDLSQFQQDAQHRGAKHKKLRA